MSLTIKVTSADDYGHNVKMLIAGDVGSGKTVASSTTPNPLIVSVEPGLMSIADRRIPYAKIEKVSDLLQLRAALDQAPETRQKLIGVPVDTVVIDTIDEVQRLLISERLAQTGEDAMRIQDFGWLREEMLKIIRGFRDLDMHFVATCHVKTVSDEETGHVAVKPGMQGALADEIGGYFDVVGVIALETALKAGDLGAQTVVKRFLRTQPDAKHAWLKDRSWKLPPKVELNGRDDFQRMTEIMFPDGEPKEAGEPVVLGEVTDQVAVPEVIQRQPEQPANPLKEAQQQAKKETV